MPSQHDSNLPAEEIQRWLARRRWQLIPRFPLALEATYRRETRAERLRAMRLGTLTGCVSGLIMAVLIWPLMPDAHDAILRVWLGCAVVSGVICHLLLWLPRLPLAVQEWQVAGGGLLVGACLSYLMVHSQFAPMSFYFGGMMLLVMLDCAAARLSVLPCTALVGGLIALFAGAAPRMHMRAGVNPDTTRVIVALLAICALYALYGTWRLESEIRRSYALAARERHERSELSLRNAELGYMLGDDPLTGLANRRAFDEWLGQHWRQAQAQATSVSLVMLDVDNFKPFNDTYGHPAGDRCLQRIALCLREEIAGSTNLVARLGGEEFAILLPLHDHANALAVAEALRMAVAGLAIPHTGSNAGHVTISAGVATLYAEAGGMPTSLVEAADQALYVAKRGGRNRVHGCAPGVGALRAAG